MFVIHMAKDNQSKAQYLSAPTLGLKGSTPRIPCGVGKGWRRKGLNHLQRGGSFITVRRFILINIDELFLAGFAGVSF